MADNDPVARARRVARTASIAGLLATSYAYMRGRESLAPPEARAALRGFHVRRFMRRCLSLLSVTVLREGDAPPRAGARVIVSNHRSGLDIPLLGSLFDAAFLSRADLGQWPAIGDAARHIGTLFVDRKDQTSRAEAIKAMRRVIEAGEGVLVFPEGTTHAGDEGMGKDEGSTEVRGIEGTKGCEIRVDLRTYRE